MASNACGSATGSRAIVTWLKVKQYLDELVEDFNITTLTPKKFRKILELAARESEWYPAPNARKGFKAVDANKPGIKRCAKCNNEKPVEDFKAEASEKRKLKYNWGREGKATAAKRIYIHSLCSVCRSNRNRKPTAQRGTVKGAAIRKQMSLINKLSHNFIAAIDQRRDPDDADWICADQRYYFHKARLRALETARKELERLEIANEPTPDKWQMLLDQPTRHRLLTMFNEIALPMWSGRGKQPKCF
jgi:hypothetical protein